MNYEQLATHRTTLLDLYTSLHEALGKEGKRVDAGLRAAQENIEAEKFLLAIVGEVKAGKSTFINALLGEAILPYEALQATSEIIEIDKSDKKEVRVSFANGTEQVVEDDLQTPENETVPFLKKIAAVKDEYRDIPIVQVNKFLMEHYSDEKGEAVFTAEKLEAFIDDPELENVRKLGKEEFASKIRKYVQNNVSCAEIPKTVALGYPIEFLQSKHFKIVDTPGINAIGGIEDQTKNFINQADAVIYLHKVGQQESIALRNALENVIPERVKERLILVLTHRSQIDEDERERILDATKSYYPEIGTDNIFLVDSLTELYLREFYGKTIDGVRAIRKENPQIRRLTADCFEMAEGDINEFLDLLEAQANFDEIRKRIERDARNSASIQMKDFATDLKEEYEVFDNNISARIEPLRKKYQNPQSFALEIDRHKKETEGMRKDYNEFTHKLNEEFNSQVINNRYYREIDQIVNGYRAKVNGKKFDPDSNTLNTVASYVEKLAEDFEDEMTQFVHSLEAGFKEKIEEKAVGVQSAYSITVPKISVHSVWASALNAANKKTKTQLDKLEESKGFGYYLRNVVFLGIPYLIKDSERDDILKSRPQKAWEDIKLKLRIHFTTSMTRLQEEIGMLINDFCDRYKRTFDKELQERQRYMENLEGDKRTNEKLGDDISSLEVEKKTIEYSINLCAKIKGELR